MSAADEFSRLPQDFYTGYLVGWRAWHIDNAYKYGETTDTLRSPYRSKTEWDTGEMVAECINATNKPIRKKLSCGKAATGDHTHHWEDCYDTYPLLDPNCTCGFYGLCVSTSTQDSDWNAYTGNGAVVRGLVAGYGRTVVGTLGFRAEKARVLAFYGTPEWHGFMGPSLNTRFPLGAEQMKALEAKYKAPWFGSFEEAVSVIPVTDLTQFAVKEDAE